MAPPSSSCASECSALLERFDKGCDRALPRPRATRFEVGAQSLPIGAFVDVVIALEQRNLEPARRAPRERLVKHRAR